MNKKEAHAEYLKRWKASGGKTRKYKCPICSAKLERNVPKHRGEVWDSAMSCTECEGLIFVITPHTGPIRAERIDD